MKSMLLAVGVVVMVVGVRAQEIGYLETFSLAGDREAALNELVPGTDEYYYFSALQAQNTGDRSRFQNLMGLWLNARHGSLTEGGRELMNREMLLDYGHEPKVTLDYLRHELGLSFTHQRKAGDRAISAPTVLDTSCLSAEVLLPRLLASNRDTLDRLEGAGLELVAVQRLTDRQRHSLLARLNRPDYPGIVGLIVADLSIPQNGHFGSLPIHSLLTLAQLDELLRQQPRVRNEAAFVTAYLSKLAPQNEVDLAADPTARQAYYDRVWAFVRTLDPVHNSLAASVLYNRLRHDEEVGSYDRARFMEYLRIPRDVRHLNPEFQAQVPRGDHVARTGQDFNLPGLPPIGDEEPLVRRYLLEFFRTDAGYDAYLPVLKDTFVKSLFAEAKITGGIGDPRQWAPLLSPEAYKSLKERVDIEFSRGNPAVVGAHDAVALTAYVKNVPTLLVKVYEINTFNYYRETGQPLNLAINLDGLVATFSRRLDYKEDAERRVARTFELPELKERGVYVVELIGNGKSSRALVQKGHLNVVQDVTAAGHAFTVLDEAGRRVVGANAWLAGHEYAAGEDGRILIPFTTQPKFENLVVREGSFSTLVHFYHLAEGYALKAGIYVDRESLIRREKALVAIRPTLTVNGKPTSLKLLEEPRLVIRSTDLHGIVTEKEVAGLALREDAETVHEIMVPESTARLSVALKGRIQNLSLNSKQDLSDEAGFELNGMERTAEVQALHVEQTAAGYGIEARGKNGELLAGEPLNCFFKHRCFCDEVEVSLKTDAQGRAMLGALEDIERFRVRASSGEELSWSPSRDACSYPSALHANEGGGLCVPITWKSDNPASKVSLLESRNGQFVKDWHDILRVKDGFLELVGLPAGDYSLYLKPVGVSIAVRVTKGEIHDGFAVSSRRALELPRLAPLNVVAITPSAGQVDISLANATAFSRVHVFATRYLPAYDLFERLGLPGGVSDLQQQPWQSVLTFYESGRDIGDEYRYIIDRQQAEKYPGNMLERPGLLLNPWAVRGTEAQAETLAEGRSYGGREGALANANGGSVACLGSGGVAAAGYVSIDFLKQPGVALLNLVPDKAGRITIPRASLKGLPLLRVLAVDPTTSVLKCAALEETPVETRELRLTAGLDSRKRYAEQKRVTAVQAGASVTIGDVATARFESYDTVAKAYRLLATLHPDATFDEFSFVAKWPELAAAEQGRLYSRYACHELNFFLYHKDPHFFAAVIAPNLKHKKDKTFMDHWLLGDDLAGYLDPWRFGRLNAAERVLLGKRLKEQEPSLVRDTRERAEMLVPDMEAFNRRFDTAVQTSSLAAQGDAPASGAVDTVRKSISEGQALGFANAFACAPAPVAAPPMEMAMAELAAGSELSSTLPAAKAPARSRTRALREVSKNKAFERASDRAGSGDFFACEDKKRDGTRRFFQKLDKTQEWAENNYYHLAQVQPLATASQVPINAFWADYAAHDGKSPFLSKAFPEATETFTAMMLALAVMDLPFKAAVHGESLAGVSYTLKAGSPVLLFHREIGEVARSLEAGGMLVDEHFFRADDRERIENGERVDKPVTEEFLPRTVYGAQVVLTNPTGNRRKVNVLMQIPVGAIPVNNGDATHGLYVVMEPYSTQTQEYSFYFPATGDFPHYPVTLACEDRVVGSAAPFTFHVVAKLSKVDTTSWAWISQNGTDDQVLDFLKAANLHRLDLGEIAWRMRDKAVFRKVIALLQSRHVYADTLWSYAVLHNEPEVIREFLQHQAFAARCGLWLESPLLTRDPVERFDYQYLEYAPLVNPRAHALGARRAILNNSFRRQYQAFMKVLSYKPRIEGADTLAVAYYLSLQDRVAEALEWFGRVDRKTVDEKLQYDYLACYLAFFKGDTEKARQLATAHADEGVPRWRDRFAAILGQLGELSGDQATVADRAKRDEAQAALAASEPVLEMQVEAGHIRLDTRNIRSCTLNYYPMDIELLFSRSPFLQEGAAQFSFIRPVLSRVVELPPGKGSLVVDLPDEFKSRNVMVEGLGAGVRKAQACYANTLKVQMIENYGQLLVTHADTGKPVPRTYVKVYAKLTDGTVRFFKDGYTDLRGRFDYASLNTNEMADATRLAVLVMSDHFGAVVREVAPPKE